MSDPQAILSSVFGFSGFRPGQEEIVDAVGEARELKIERQKEEVKNSNGSSG